MGKARPAARARPGANPFEVKVNRKKFPVLGHRARHDVGQPGASRARALRKRTQTLLKEYKERDKANVFTDRRLGEHSHGMSAEEKMACRFALERQRQHERKSIYNLNEDEELTHYGQSLADLEKHHAVMDSDDDGDDRGTLSAELTAAHFGGGGLPHRKSEDGEKAKSRRELIEELIAKSKQEKRERQAQREDALELTEKLDQDWRAIQTLLSHRRPKVAGGATEKPQPDAYDMTVRELGFEMKAQPSERLKTKEELAAEEQDRLQKLEAERARRMLGTGEDEGTKKAKHVSADDLGDSFVLDRDDRRLLSYKDGKMNVEGQQLSGDDGEGNSELGEGDSEESGDPDSHSDLDSDAESEQSSEPGGDKPRQAGRRGPPGEAHPSWRAAGTELPYTFAAPETREELSSLLAGRAAEEQLAVLERIQKCNHPSLATGNKAKLEKLFGFLLEHVGDLATSDPPDLGAIDKLVVPLYQLCQMFPNSSSHSMRFVLRDAMHEMEEMVESKGRATFPGLDVLIYLKLTGLLFPTSDFRHPVVTPALLCMSQLLTKCLVLSLQDAVKGLFVCSMFLDFVSLSQRLIPELLNFLLGILYIAAPDKQGQGHVLVHPFRARGKNSELLLVSDDEDMATWQRQALSLRWAAGALKGQSASEANHTRLSCLAACVALVKRCVTMYSTLPASHHVTGPLRDLLALHLSRSGYPLELQALCQSALAEMDSQKQSYRPMVCERTRPQPPKLFTPRLVRVLECGRKQGRTKEEQERRRLIHKHRREFKGAVREIRKDNQFLARMQLAETLERDAERKRRVKQLLGSLATQEGEWKALKRRRAVKK